MTMTKKHILEHSNNNNENGKAMYIGIITDFFFLFLCVLKCLKRNNYKRRNENEKKKQELQIMNVWRQRENTLGKKNEKRNQHRKSINFRNGLN